jgi:hypothetical protein
MPACLLLFLLTFFLHSCAKDLKKNIDSGYPLIVLVDYGFWAFHSNHFMVVVGYNENGVIVNSGQKKKRGREAVPKYKNIFK